MFVAIQWPKGQSNTCSSMHDWIKKKKKVEKPCNGILFSLAKEGII
jgi:hypothetical protein